jgi:general secretion pathway protein H
MTISATGTCNNRHRRHCPVTADRRTAGFTLLELMVVMVLIGIIFTFATLSMKGDDVAGLMQQESQRMETLINLASDEAVVRGEELAIRFHDDSYEFMVLADTGWKAASDGMLKEYRMPADIQLHLDVSGDLPVFVSAKDDKEDKDRQDSKDAAKEDPPQVFILSSGEVTPFSVQFQSHLSKREYLLETSVLGTVTVTGEDVY